MGFATTRTALFLDRSSFSNRCVSGRVAEKSSGKTNRNRADDADADETFCLSGRRHVRARAATGDRQLDYITIRHRPSLPSDRGRNEDRLTGK